MRSYGAIITIHMTLVNSIINHLPIGLRKFGLLVAQANHIYDLPEYREKGSGMKENTSE